MPRVNRSRQFHEPFHVAVLAADVAAEAALVLGSYGNARVTGPFRRRGGVAGQRWRLVIAVQKRMEGFLGGAPRFHDPPNDSTLVAAGTALFEMLFTGDVRRLYDEARATAGRRRIDLVLTSMIDWVAAAPWELLYDPTRRSFLALEDVHLVRNVFTAVPAELPAARPAPLRVLLAVAQPSDFAPLSSKEEMASIRQAWAPLGDSGRVEITHVPRATAEKLQRRLGSGRFDVLHFVGHGTHDDTVGGALLLEDDAGKSRPMDHTALRRLLVRRGVSLVFLNTCESGRGSRLAFSRGLAPALLAGGVPATVANQFAVGDQAAVRFAREFYRSLAEGKTLGEAALEARLAVAPAPGHSSLDWLVPVLFARNPGDVLCTSRPKQGRSGAKRRGPVSEVS